jgi:hypothetical protein
LIFCCWSFAGFQSRNVEFRCFYPKNIEFRWFLAQKYQNWATFSLKIVKFKWFSAWKCWVLIQKWWI